MHSETTGTPGLLLASDGTLLSSIIEQRQRDFTLHYLRHSISGTKLEQETPLGPHLVTAAEHAFVTSPEPHALLVRPSDEEIAEHTPLPEAAPAESPAPPAVPTVQRLNFTHMRERALSNNLAKIDTLEQLGDVPKALQARLEVHRTAVSLVMERVLSAVMDDDSAAFIPAQRELETTLRHGRVLIGEYLTSHGVIGPERERVLDQLGEGQIITAIEGRLNQLETIADKEMLYANYSRCMEAYRATVAPTKATPNAREGWAEQMRTSGSHLAALQRGEESDTPLPTRVLRR